jgi:two-component system sensor histidine kinase HydH
MAGDAPTRARPSALRARIAARAGPVGRWGLLLTAIGLVIALLATGVSTYLAVGSSTVPIVRSLARELVASARHSLHVGDVVTPDAVEEVLASLAREGVRYVAVVRPDGTAVVAAGAPAATNWSLAAEADGPGPRVELGDGTLARATAPFIGAGRGAGWRARTGAGPDVPLPWQALADARIVVEFQPAAVQHLRSHVLATVVIGACTAMLLLAAAIVFWRLSVRAERASAQLERDRQLKKLGEMSAVLGHELRNPLAGLKGHAQLAVRKLAVDHPARAATETVIREAVRLEQLANQVLEFARTGEVDRRAEDPLAIARAAADAVSSERVLVARAAAPLPRWPLDRARIEQVLTNLLRNAVQASPDGRSVELAAFLDGDETLVYEVRDRGEGLRPGDEDAIFEPFVTRRAKGSGLGLTVARQIVQQHGGVVEAQNRPDGGAIFRVRIPRGEASCPSAS